MITTKEMHAFVKADLRFHGELAAAVSNFVLLDLLGIIRSPLQVWADRAVQGLDEARTPIAEHAAVFAAIASGAGDAAASAMAAHILTAGIRLSSNLPSN